MLLMFLLLKRWHANEVRLIIMHKNMFFFADEIMYVFFSLLKNQIDIHALFNTGFFKHFFCIQNIEIRLNNLS